jgi:hypothetical protein
MSSAPNRIRTKFERAAMPYKIESMNNMDTVISRRRFQVAAMSAATFFALFAYRKAYAVTLGELSNLEASNGLKLALEKGALAAVKLLGQQGGFLENERVKIPLPGFLTEAANLMRALGQGGRVDELVIAMNRGAEASVPFAKNLLVNAAQGMTVVDAKNILAGGDTAVTQFFVEKTRSSLALKFLPVVSRVTEKVGMVAKYNQLAGQAAQLGLLRKEDANMEQYVTEKTLDGLYLMIADEEKKIRQDPVCYGSHLLTKVFSVLR